MLKTDLWTVLSATQQYLTRNYASALTDESKHNQLRSYIEKYILDNGYTVPDLRDDELINRLYSEMVEYSILTPYLGCPELDEININSWDDIVLTYSDVFFPKIKPGVMNTPASYNILSESCCPMHASEFAHLQTAGSTFPHRNIPDELLSYFTPSISKISPASTRRRAYSSLRAVNHPGPCFNASTAAIWSGLNIPESI